MNIWMNNCQLLCILHMWRYQQMNAKVCNIQSFASNDSFNKQWDILIICHTWCETRAVLSALCKTTMKERVSKLTYPMLQHCLRMLYTMNSNSKHYWQAIRQKTSFIWVAKIILAKVQKGYKLLLKNIKSAFPVTILSTYYVLHNYKVSRNSVKLFQWSCAE